MKGILEGDGVTGRGRSLSGLTGGLVKYICVRSDCVRVVVKRDFACAVCCLVHACLQHGLLDIPTAHVGTVVDHVG